MLSASRESRGRPLIQGQGAPPRIPYHHRPLTLRFGFRVVGLEFRVSRERKDGQLVQGSGVLGIGVQGPGFRVQGPGPRVQGSGFRIQGSEFRVQGSGFMVQDSGFRV